MSEQPEKKRRAWWKRLLGWAAILLALMVVWVGIEHLRGRRLLAEALGVRVLTNAVWTEPPVPTVRLMSLPPRLRAAAELGVSLTNFALRLPPAVVLLRNGDAIPSNELDRWALSDPFMTNDWQKVAALLEQSRPEVDRVEAILTGTAPIPEGRIGIREPRDVSAWAFGWVRFVEAKALVALRDRRTADALRELRLLEAVHREILAATQSGEPSDQVAGMSLCRVLERRIGVLRWAFIHSGVSADELVAGLVPESLLRLELESWKKLFLQERLGWASRFKSADEGLIAENIAYMWSPTEWGLADSVDGDTTFGGILERTLEIADKVVDPVLKNAGYPVWRLGWGDQSIASLVRHGDAFVTVVDEAIENGAFGEAQIDRPLGFGSVYQRALGSEGPFESLATGHLFRIIREEVARRLDRTAIAIRRFHASKGRYPDSLEQLVPEFLTKVPVDPWNSAPLRYRLHPTGGFRLYSVGEDRVDGGGKSGYPGQETARMLGVEFGRANIWGLDIVWPGRATEEQKRLVASEAEARWARMKPTQSGSVPGLDPVLMKRYGLIPRTKAE